MSGHVRGMIVDMPTPDDNGRPRWSAAEAAKRCGVGRATIQRRLDAGQIPGATKTEQGWSIPLEGLLAAGFTPDRPSPPEDAREHVRAPVEHDHLAARVRELEQQLADAHAARAHAEQIAAERDRVIEAQAAHLRMLTAGPVVAAPAPTQEPPPPRPTLVPDPPAPRRGFLGRIVDGFGL
jgi:hypothetical protein